MILSFPLLKVPQVQLVQPVPQVPQVPHVPATTTAARRRARSSSRCGSTTRQSPSTRRSPTSSTRVSRLKKVQIFQSSISLYHDGQY